MRPTTRFPGRRGAIPAILALSLLSACQTATPSDSSLSAISPAASRITAARLLPNCSDTQSAAQRARESLRSWYEVVGFLEECDLPRVRYYTNQTNQSRLMGTLDRASDGGSASCQAEVVDLKRRLQGTVDELKSFLDHNWNYCTLAFRNRQLDQSSRDFQDALQTTNCRIARLFPELSDDPAKACASSGAFLGS